MLPSDLPVEWINSSALNSESPVYTGVVVTSPWGLILFIGIPLPFTGVWTGALAAYLLSIPKSYTISGIILGVIMSGMIVTCMSILLGL